MKKYLSFILILSIILFLACASGKKKYPIVVTDSRQLTEANEVLDAINSKDLSGRGEQFKNKLKELAERLVSDIQAARVTDVEAADIIYEFNNALSRSNDMENMMSNGDSSPGMGGYSGGMGGGMGRHRGGGSGTPGDRVTQKIEKMLDDGENNADAVPSPTIDMTK